MTKEFCDFCKKEVFDRKMVKMSFLGSITTKSFLVDKTIFCEECYIKFDNSLKNFRSSQTT